ncbi:MAG: class I SAM-dependent methyltransferase [Candidatus Methylomirabilales bacterium]
MKTKRNMVNGNKGLVKPERLVGRVAAIERDGRRKKCDDRLARLCHIVYWTARPLIRIFLMVRKIVTLFQPRFFVKDPGSSLRCVAEKYNDAKEVLYYSQRVFEGLDMQERHLVDQFMSQRGRVLNIGCGAGREALTLAEAGFDVVGIDVAPGMIAEAKRHAETSGIPIQFEVRDATALDYAPSSFDYVWISDTVYSYIPTRQLRVITLRRISDLLTPNGSLFFSVEYQGSSFLPRVILYDAFRRIAKPILKNRLHSEPGDVKVRYVSPAGSPSKLCYTHLFRDPSEVLEEIMLAGLDGFEDGKSGYWVVKLCREGMPREVAA